MAINNLEALRKKGNFTPQKPFLETKDNSHKPVLESNTDKKVDETAKYIPATNQRKTLKVSPQTKAEIEELKRYLKMGFNYEVIQFLIDDYVDAHLSSSEKRRFKENTE